MIHKNLFCYSERSEIFSFKIQWPQGRGGSIPPSPTTIGQNGAWPTRAFGFWPGCVFEEKFRENRRLNSHLGVPQKSHYETLPPQVLCGTP